ncbi:hypothetical protein DV515_00017319, partial [Chloebia gouldiae]
MAIPNGSESPGNLHPMAIPNGSEPPKNLHPMGIPSGSEPPKNLHPMGIPSGAEPPRNLHPMAIPSGAEPPKNLHPMTIPSGSEPPRNLHPMAIPSGAEPPGNLHPMAIPSIAEPPRNLNPRGIPSITFTLQGDNSDSHALNLLADLALGSCVPAFIPKDPGMVPVESGDSWEQQSPPDHKYHRADKQGKAPTSTSSKAAPTPALPEEMDSSLPASPPREKTSGISSRSSGVPIPAAFQAFPARQAPQAAEVRRRSIISAEHSYASPMPDDPKTSPDPKENPGAGSRAAPAAPLVGKVLPFRHQRSSAAEPARSSGAPGKREDFSRSHVVSVSGNSVKVTCRWEEEYLFHLDSRYTNDALEKTVVRALHGPWDPDLPDDVEGMKLILHMWVALFYRKPSKLLSSSRKVVEHSNPRKFVSISSSGGFLELSDDSQDCFGLETCPADSGSDPDQTPSSSLDPSAPSQGASQPGKSRADSQADAAGAGDSTVSSSSGELPGGDEEEPSSTSWPESPALRGGATEELDGAGGEPDRIPKDGIPDGIPEEGIPEDGIPEDGIPKDGIPDAIPEEAIPEDGIPKEAIPEEAIPEDGIPKEAIPEEAIPEEAIPEDGIPKEAIPEEAIPQEAIPQEGISKEAIPKEAIPQEGIPEEAIPQEGIPQEAIPKEAIPQEGIPKEAIPKEAIPEEAIPKEAIPKDGIPEEAIPKEAIPKDGIPEDKEGIPKEAILEDSIPEEGIPQEAIPQEAIPEEAIPQEAIPKEGVHNVSSVTTSAPGQEWRFWG